MKELDNLLKKIYEYKRFGVRLGLDRIRYLTRKLGYPQNNFKVIHVGGTNGKGSVCRFIGSILQEGGYTVGIYTSPHLVHIRERFIVDGRPIRDKELYTVLNSVLDIAENMDDKPTFFEIATAAAFEYFDIMDVDFGIIEVGLGGKYDATNVVDPIISVITNVERDHTDILGGNIENIAKEKAGIIKKNTPIVTGCKGRSLDIIKDVAKSIGSEVVVPRGWKRLDFGEGWQRFLIMGELSDYDLTINMMGRFQGHNLSLAIAAIERLQMMGVYLTHDSIKHGVEKTINPGRMEIVSKDPRIILDGAHNIHGIKSLVESLDDISYDHLILILGFLRDKDVRGMIREIAPIADYVIATMSRNERACKPNVIADLVNIYNSRCDVYITENVGKAIKKAERLYKNKDLICITGSLYTVGEARDILKTLSK